MEIDDVIGIGPKLKKTLEKINIFSIFDLIEYYPYKYNFINIIDINEEVEQYTIKAKIIEIPRVQFFKKSLNKMSFRVLTSDKLINVIIFNRSFLKNNIIVDNEVVLIGKYDKLKNVFTASDIKFNVLDNSILPVYHLTEGINTNLISKLINNAIKLVSIKDYIPEYINERYNFINKIIAIDYIHNPSSIENIKIARLKLCYEEFFIFMFKINYLKSIKEKTRGIKRSIINIEDFINKLPFILTKDQVCSINDILIDMNSSYQMNRLVLGDVGSGKTIVALLAIYINKQSNYQSAFMAPTEILANQHYNNIIKLVSNINMKVVLLTGKTTKKEKEKIYKEIENGNIDLVIGTHALYNEQIKYKKLGLVITDEQHRFGVNARKLLQNKGILPDILYLSATPIPRTYALTIYGDLNISLIKTKPVGRKDIITKLIKEIDIKQVLYHMLEELNNNHQIYVVSPLIENNDLIELKSVTKLKEKLALAFPQVRIEILHSKLNSNEKNQIMEDFETNKIKILISTTVIEVGIDVKNANMMVIFNAERFGLATLHQLRGRVGRGSEQSYCYLISNYDKERLKVLEESNDGFYISEKDFELRGAGDIFGIKQSGDMQFKIADIKRDYKILLQAKKDSDEFLKSGKYLENEYYKNIISDMNIVT